MTEQDAAAHPAPTSDQLRFEALPTMDDLDDLQIDLDGIDEVLVALDAAPTAEEARPPSD